MNSHNGFINTQWLRVPVTALKFAPLDSLSNLVLSGQGPYFVVSITEQSPESQNTFESDTSSCEVARSLAFPNAQPIHGIAICGGPDSFTGKETKNETGGAIRTIRWCGLLWGGRVLRQILITAREGKGQLDWAVEVKLAKKEVLNDWIFGIRFQPDGDQIVQKITSTGRPHMLRAVIVTAHNSIRQIAGEVQTKESQSLGWNWAISTIKPSSRCLLYSADIRWVSSSSAIVVSGTCYGEICVWMCRVPDRQSNVSGSLIFRDDTSTGQALETAENDAGHEYEHMSVLKVLPGHEGSVFGLAISTPEDRRELGSDEYLILSCSDDRMVHVWDVTLSRTSSPRSSTASRAKSIIDVEQSLGNRHTGFEIRQGNSTNEDANSENTRPLTSAWALQSRVWLVQALMFPQPRGSPSRPNLDSRHPDRQIILSAGEDATLHVWELESVHSPHDETKKESGDRGTPLKGKGAVALKEILTSKHHAGKNVWAMDYYLRETEAGQQLIVLTGGADGQITLHRVLSASYTGPKFSTGDSKNRQNGKSDSLSWSIEEAVSAALVSTLATASRPESHSALSNLLPGSGVKDSFRAFDYICPRRLIVTTNTGRILLAHHRPLNRESGSERTDSEAENSAGDDSPRSRLSWTTVTQSGSLRGFSIVRSCPELQGAFVAGSTEVILIRQSELTSTTNEINGAFLDEIPIPVTLSGRDNSTLPPFKISDILTATVSVVGRSDIVFSFHHLVALLVCFSPPHHPRVVVLGIIGSLPPKVLAQYTLLPCLPTSPEGEDTVQRIKPAVPTAFSVIFGSSNSCLVGFVGTRAGETLVYCFPGGDCSTQKDGVEFPSGEEITPSTVTRSHRGEAVTSFLWQPRKPTVAVHTSSAPPSGWLFSTGRGGYVNVEAVTFPQLPAPSPVDGTLNRTPPSSSSPTLSLVHSLRLPLGPNVEGITEIAAPNSESSFTSFSSSSSIVAYGFRKTRFVVLDVRTLRDLYSVECGGAHRVWAVQKGGKSASINQPTTWSFGWSQSKRLNWWSSYSFAPYPYAESKMGPSPIQHFSSSPAASIIQSGIHGREIKACAVTTLDKSTALVATGSEDTDIKLFISPEEQEDSPVIDNCCHSPRSYRTASQLECVATLRHHTTGLQALSWAPLVSPDMKERYLFSSGGVEELCAWRITPSLPHMQLGVLLAAELPPMNKGISSDLRFTNIHISLSSNTKTHVLAESVGASSPQVSYDIIAATSDSHLQFFTFTQSPNQPGQWYRIFSVSYLTSCLTQVLALPIISSYGSDEGLPPPVLATSTDGHLLILRPSSETGPHYPIQLQSRHRLHQSSILALSYLQLPYSYHLIVTGGDDNALAFTLYRQSHPQASHFAPSEYREGAAKECASVIIPRSHASSVKAACIISHRIDPIPTPNMPKICSPSSEFSDNCTVKVLSAGNDQILCLWEVSLSLRSQPSDGHGENRTKPEQVRVRRLAIRRTPVADVAEIVFFTKEAPEIDERNVLISGIGMEVVRVKA